MAQLTNEIISAAIEGFEGQKRRIDEQIAELRSMLNGSRARFTTSSNGKGRTISAAGRARIAEAQRARWAASRAEAGTTATAPSKPKRRLSAAGRAAIVAALKKRWAAKKAGSASPKALTAKKAAPVRKKATKRTPMKSAVKKTPTTPAKTANATS